MNTWRAPSTGETTLGSYRLIATLGQGGMASVRLAVKRGPAGFNKLVVLKQIHPQYADDPEVLGMFRDEAQLAARLSHPNIVQTNEVGRDGERHFIAMEYLEGQPFNRILHRLGGGGLTPAMRLQVIVDLLSGLHHAHELADYDGSPLGVVHRDVNPQNVFVTYDGIVKVVDFGIAKAKSSRVETRFGVVKGKVSYLAPEQARGERVDRRADLFAVGVMLWEAATGARPWKGVPDAGVMKSLADGKFPAVRAAAPDIPERFEDIILKALAPDREDRYATALDLQADLEAYLETTGERVHGRALGQLISSHFAADRAAMKAVIEAQLRSDDAAPAVDPSTTPDGRPGQRGSAGAISVRAPATGPAELTTSVTGALSRLHPGRGLRAWATALTAAALCASLGLWLRAALPGGPAPARASLEAAAANRAPPPSPRVELRLAATPVGARLFLDDQPLVGNPIDEALPRDDATHQLRFEAPGFVSRTESVTFDKDLVAVNVALAAELQEPEARPPSTAARPASGLHRPRRLDANNPYGDR